MENLKKQVEDMIREGKTDADSQARIETLKGILRMLQAPKVPLKDDKDIHKIDEKDGSIKTEDKFIVSSQEGTEVSKDNTNFINVIKKDENVTLKVQFERSDKFNSDDYNVTKAVESINTNLHKSKEETEKTVKQVTFAESVQTAESACLYTIAQLDDTFELQIDETEVTDTGQQDKVVIESVVNELIDAVVNEEDHGTGDAADDLSSTLPCSQMPRINPYSHKKETSPDNIR